MKKYNKVKLLHANKVALESQSKESSKIKGISNCDKPSSLVRLYPNCSIHHREIGISQSSTPFFYLAKSLQSTKPSSMKITRLNETSNLSSSKLKSSTTS